MRFGLASFAIAAAVACGSVRADDTAGARFGGLVMTATIPTMTTTGKRLPMSMRDPKRAADTLDEIFEELIEAYPEAVRSRLRQMYFRGPWRFDPELAQSGSRGGLYSELREDGLLLEVRLGTFLREMPLQRKDTLIHEVAVHAGQTVDRFRQLGAAFDGERLTPEWRRFTEGTAALVERLVREVVPAEYFVDEIERTTLDAETRARLLQSQHVLAKASVELYPWLALHLFYRDLSGTLTESEASRLVHYYRRAEAERHGPSGASAAALAH